MLASTYCQKRQTALAYHQLTPYYGSPTLEQLTAESGCQNMMRRNVAWWMYLLKNACRKKKSIRMASENGSNCKYCNNTNFSRRISIRDKLSMEFKCLLLNSSKYKEIVYLEIFHFKVPCLSHCSSLLLGNFGSSMKINWKSFKWSSLVSLPLFYS